MTIDLRLPLTPRDSTRGRGGVIAALVAFSLVAGAAAADAEALRLGHHHAVGGSVDRAANRLAELVAERSSGALTIDVFPAAQLGQELEAFQLVDQGAIDMSVTSLGLMDQYYPPMAVTSLPFLITSWELAETLFEGEFGAALAAGLRGVTDVQLLGYMHLGFRDMLFRGNPVTAADGMQGLRMRSPESLVWIRMFELLGSRPTPVTWGEVYTAMQTGVADGLESPPMAARDMRFYEVTTSLVKTGHMFGSMAITINADSLDRLSIEHQVLLRQAALDAARFHNDEISKPGEQAAYDALASGGMAILEPEDISAWAEMVRPLWDEIAQVRPGTAAYIEMILNAND